MKTYLEALQWLFNQLRPSKLATANGVVNLRSCRDDLFKKRIAALGQEIPGGYFSAQQSAEESITLLTHNFGLIPVIRRVGRYRIDTFKEGEVHSTIPPADAQITEWFSMKAVPLLNVRNCTLRQAILNSLTEMIDKSKVQSVYTGVSDYVIVYVDRSNPTKFGEEYVTQKIQTPVTVDEEVDLAGIVEDDVPSRYESRVFVPVAMIIHIGETPTGGHYIALTKREGQDEVTCYNDSTILSSATKGRAKYTTFHGMIGSLDAGRNDPYTYYSITHVLLYRKDKWEQINQTALAAQKRQPAAS